MSVANNSAPSYIRAGHRFVELLHRHGKLTRLYTQNIDGLDYQTAVRPSVAPPLPSTSVAATGFLQVPADKVVPVHGTIGRVGCERRGRRTTSA